MTAKIECTNCAGTGQRDGTECRWCSGWGTYVPLIDALATALGDGAPATHDDG